MVLLVETLFEATNLYQFPAVRVTAVLLCLKGVVEAKEIAEPTFDQLGAVMEVEVCNWTVPGVLVEGLSAVAS